MFKRYVHLESLKSEEVQGLLDERCYVQPKLDGANASIWFDGYVVRCGCLNHALDEDNTLRGFYDWVKENGEQLKALFFEYPMVILYGEWLVPHTVKHYVDSAWRKFYVFDVYDVRREYFMDYETVATLSHFYGLEYVPVFDETRPGELFNFEECLKSCRWLLKEGEGQHEGMVFKRKDYINKWGRIAFGKYVPVSLMKSKVKSDRSIALDGSVEAEIIRCYLTESLVDKEIAKVRVARGFETADPKLIGHSLEAVWHAFITEEIWDVLKKYRNPKIDFSVLKKLCDEQVRIKFLGGYDE